jgi:hypothetical protein
MRPGSPGILPTKKSSARLAPGWNVDDAFRQLPCRIDTTIRPETPPRKWSCLARIRNRRQGRLQAFRGRKSGGQHNSAEVLPSGHGSDGTMPRHHLPCYNATSGPLVSGGPVSSGSRLLNPRHGTRDSGAKHATYRPSASRHIRRRSCRLAHESAMGLKTSCRCRTAQSTSAAGQHTVRLLKAIMLAHHGFTRRMLAHLVHAGFATAERRPGKVAGLQPVPVSNRSHRWVTGRRTSPFDPQVADALEWLTIFT